MNIFVFVFTSYQTHMTLSYVLYSYYNILYLRKFSTDTSTFNKEFNIFNYLNTITFDQKLTAWSSIHFENIAIIPISIRSFSNIQKSCLRSFIIDIMRQFDIQYTGTRNNTNRGNEQRAICTRVYVVKFPLLINGNLWK